MVTIFQDIPVLSG